MLATVRQASMRAVEGAGTCEGCRAEGRWRSTLSGRMRRSPVPVAVVVLAVLLIGVLAYALIGGGSGSNLDSAVQRGERPVVPDGGAALALPVLGGAAGETQRLDALRGKVVVVNVWGSWCEPCESEAPLISEIHDVLQRSGEGQVLGVTHVDPTEKSLAFVKEYDLTFPSVRDVEDELYDAFGGTGTPETYVLDREGRVAAISRGVITAEFANKALARVGVKARVSETSESAS